MIRGRTWSRSVTRWPTGRRATATRMAEGDQAIQCQPNGGSDQACAIIENWDGLFNVDSVGPALFFGVERVLRTASPFGTPGLWAVPFDATDPVNTPNTLNDEEPGGRSGALLDRRRGGPPRRRGDSARPTLGRSPVPLERGSAPSASHPRRLRRAVVDVSASSVPRTWSTARATPTSSLATATSKRSPGMRPSARTRLRCSPTHSRSTRRLRTTPT